MARWNVPPSQIWCISVTTLALAFGRRVWKWQGQAGYDRGGSGRGVCVAYPNKRRFQMYMRGKKERRIRRLVLWAINACVGTVLHRTLLLPLSTQL